VEAIGFRATLARMDERPQLKDFALDPLRARFAAEGLPRYRADQVAAWVYRRGEHDPERMTDLSRELRDRLRETWALRALRVEQVDRSVDGTVKARLRTRDDLRIESVWIPEEGRTTLCVSTQVGCAMACSFCATGFMGFARNLRTAEIVDQVCQMREIAGGGQLPSNVVFMGMGEPLLNLEAVVAAAQLLIDPKAFALAPRRVTVSTVGVVPRIGELLARVPVNLAVSLHATRNEVRDRLVPLNRRYPLEQLLGALRDLPGLTRRRPVFFEYTLIAGVNDSLEDARRLPALLDGIPYKLNLIPMNPHPSSPFTPPDAAVIDAFLAELSRRDVTVTLRRSRGPDIQAACGQLALRRPSASAA
jgi:23S rRNA (adenine2503-C2)-methyltransferase